MITRHLVKLGGVRVLIRIESDWKRVIIEPDEYDLNKIDDDGVLKLWSFLGEWAKRLRVTLPGWKVNGLDSTTPEERCLRG